MERQWTTIEDARREIEELMGDRATREIAQAVTSRLRETGVIHHDGQRLVADLENVDLWAVVGGLAVGDEVEGGEVGTDDYDTGRVVAVDGEQVTVAWSNGERTTQPADLLRTVGMMTLTVDRD